MKSIDRKAAKDMTREQVERVREAALNQDSVEIHGAWVVQLCDAALRDMDRRAGKEPA